MIADDFRICFHANHQSVMVFVRIWFRGNIVADPLRKLCFGIVMNCSICSDTLMVLDTKKGTKGDLMHQKPGIASPTDTDIP